MQPRRRLRATSSLFWFAGFSSYLSGI